MRLIDCLAAGATIGVLLVTRSPVAHAQTGGHGTMLGAVEGGAMGAFAGTTIGRLGWCRDKTKACNGPAIGFLLGTTLGTIAGATDTARVRGAAIGLGIGALTGVAVSSLVALGRRDDPAAPSALHDLFKGLTIGAAVGSLVGGLITHAPGGAALGESATILHLSF